MAKSKEVIRQISDAVAACAEKKAEDVAILELDKASGAFTDYFVICSGSNPRQIQAISDEVEQRLGQAGLRPTHVEGYQQADWVLLDYVDFVIHVFSPRARGFYNLERLWKSARRLAPNDLRTGVPRPARRPAAKSATKTGPSKRTATKRGRSRPRSRRS